MILTVDSVTPMEQAKPEGGSEEQRVLWDRYLTDQTIDLRNSLIEAYLPFAHKVAAALYARRKDNSVEFSDYLQFARLGLVEAIDRFDPEREARFTTYAAYRIRGAVLNGIEKSTELLTQKAERRRILRERAESVEKGSEATDAFVRMVDLTLSLAIGYLLEESGIWKDNEQDHENDPYFSLEFRRLSERMRTIVSELPERERLIVHYHYFEHKEFGEIVQLLSLSKGRISQLHARALGLLRERYRALTQFDRQV